MIILMAKHFLGKRLLVFTAHPDDEGLAAGTMYANHKAGGETFLVCATYGEKGKSNLKRHLSDAALARVRKKELLKAAKVLRINKVIFFGLPDTKVRENAKALYKKGLALVQKIKPDYILSFGPEGISAHWDHITVGRIALKIAKRMKIPLAAFTLSDEMRVQRRRKEFFLRRRKFGSYAGFPKHRKADIMIAINPRVKRRAMSFHVSQFAGRVPFTAPLQKIAPRMFRYEYFVKEKI